MKKNMLFILGLLLSGSLLAQESNKEGRVVYQEVTKIEIKLEGDAAQFANSLPKERKASKELVFNAESSIYRNNKDAESAEDVAMEQGGAMVQIKMMEPDNQLFADLNKKKTIEQREFMTRSFLIEGELEASGWKLTGEQKMVLDYPCQQATQTNEEGQTTIAWFTPSIPVSTGPGKYLGLPGLVLEIESNNGDHHILAQKIELTAVSKDQLVKPKGGKKVSQKEFDQIVEEKMKEMGAEAGGGHGTFIMKIER